MGNPRLCRPELEETLAGAHETEIEEGKIKSPLTIFATSELPTREEHREASACAEERKTLLSECEKESERKPQSLISSLQRRVSSFPWKLQLTRVTREEEEEVGVQIGVPPEGESCYPVEGEQSASWEKVPSGCVKIDIVCPQIPADVLFYGRVEPIIENGVKNGLFASRVVFGPAAGQLVSSVGEAPETTTAGELRIAGAGALELITAK